MGNLKTRISFKNKYEIELVDAQGRLKEKAYAYNTVTNSFWNYFFRSSSNYSMYLFRYIGIGTGSGTPSPSDSSFFRYLTYVEAEGVSYEKAYPTSTWVVKATFPATSSIVGTISEVGFVHSNSYSSTCITHAMLQDAEGNTITIDKTDTDILIVTATVYVTITAAEKLKMVSPENNGFLSRMGNACSSGMSTFGSAYLHACPALAEGFASASFGSSAGTEARSFSTYTPRLNVSDGNNRYVNMISVGSFGSIDLPDPDIFPAYQLQPMMVGTGDGVTTEFVCPIPEFIEGTEIVTVNGVPLTRDVDYTVDPKGNTARNASIAASNLAKAITGGNNNYHYSVYTLGISYARVSYKSVGTLTGGPLVFDMGEDKECNCLFIDALMLSYGSSDTSSSTYAVTLLLEYSADGTTWDEATRVSQNVVRYGSEVHIAESDKNKTYTFDSITARYWRLRLSDDSYSLAITYGIGSAYGNSWFGKLGRGIVFTNPPAEGSSITITAAVDRPFKTSDYVLDWSATVYM